MAEGLTQVKKHEIAAVLLKILAAYFLVTASASIVSFTLSTILRFMTERASYGMPPSGSVASMVPWLTGHCFTALCGILILRHTDWVVEKLGIRKD